MSNKFKKEKMNHKVLGRHLDIEILTENMVLFGQIITQVKLLSWCLW